MEILLGLLCLAFFIYFLVINPLKEREKRMEIEKEKQRIEKIKMLSSLETRYWRGYRHFKSNHPDWTDDDFYAHANEIISAHSELETEIERAEREERRRKAEMQESVRQYFSKVINKSVEKSLAEMKKEEEKYRDSVLFFDTETTGIPQNYNAPVSNTSNWPRLVQIAWIICDKEGKVLKNKSVLIKPSGFIIPQDATNVHGITTDRAERLGTELRSVLDEFVKDLAKASKIVGHNIDFDQRVVGAELYRLGMDISRLMNMPSVCTMKASTRFCAIPDPKGYGDYKWPRLEELYNKLFGHSFEGAHDAMADIRATKECYYELKRRGII